MLKKIYTSILRNNIKNEAQAKITFFLFGRKQEQAFALWLSEA
jgi:hypothetical protein